MFGGKGGLGKTTFSAATAYWLAQQGKRVLVFSVDPQASLSDIFQQDIFGKGPVKIMDNLWAQEIDADSHIKAYQEEIRQKILDMYGLRRGARGDRGLHRGRHPPEPAMEESAIFDAVVDIVVQGDYDYYIYDLVPLGHALYYLSMAKVYDEWISKITKLREEMREYEGGRRPDEAPEGDRGGPDPQRAAVHPGADQRLVADPDRPRADGLLLRGRPGEMILLDTRKAAELFAKFDVPIGGYIVNRVIPDELASRRSRPTCATAFTMQRGTSMRSAGQLGGAGPGHVPELERDVTGLPMIERLAQITDDEETAMTRRADAADDLSRRRWSTIFTQHPELRYIFFGGKGGVGKTVMAGATAWCSSPRASGYAGLHKPGPQPERPVSARTSSAAHGGQGRRQPVGLRDRHEGDDRALQAGDPEKDPVVPEVRRDLHQGRRVRRGRNMNPAFEESAMFENMVDLMFKDEYDVYVFDTAPTANARRLLGMSKVYALWVNKMLKSREEALAARGPVLHEEEGEDPLMEYLVDFRERIGHARELLTDPEKTAFFFVTLPEALPIAVIPRFIDWFHDFGIPVGGVVVNMVIRPEEGERRRTSSATGSRCRAPISRRSGGRSTAVRAVLPLYDSDVRGVPMLDKEGATPPVAFGALTHPRSRGQKGLRQKVRRVHDSLRAYDSPRPSPSRGRRSVPPLGGPS